MVNRVYDVKGGKLNGEDIARCDVTWSGLAPVEGLPSMLRAVHEGECHVATDQRKGETRYDYYVKVIGGVRMTTTAGGCVVGLLVAVHEWPDDEPFPRLAYYSLYYDRGTSTLRAVEMEVRS